MQRRLIITCVALTVAALHFLTGEGYRGPFPIFVKGHPIFGSAFDPYDILAFALGILFGVLLETLVLSRFVPNWDEK